MESQSQKVVGLWGTAKEWRAWPEPDAPAVLAAYKTYLGMDSLADWAGPEGTKYAENGLYSASAGLLLACQSGFYVAYPDYTFEAGGDQQRMYFSLSAASVEESTVRGWQEYQRSFGAGAFGQADADTAPAARRSSRKRRRWDEADFCTVPCPGAAGRMRARPQRPFLRRAGLLPNGAGAAAPTFAVGVLDTVQWSGYGTGSNGGDAYYELAVLAENAAGRDGLTRRVSMPLRTVTLR